MRAISAEANDVHLVSLIVDSLERHTVQIPVPWYCKRLLKGPSSNLAHNRTNPHHARSIPETCTAFLIRIFALSICIILLNKVVIILGSRTRHPSHAVARPAGRSLARRSLLRNRVASVDPVSVDVDGR